MPFMVDFLHFVLSLKEALSVLMLCAPLFMCTSGSTALLGHPRGLSIQLSTCSIQFSEFLPICLTRK